MPKALVNSKLFFNKPKPKEDTTSSPLYPGLQTFKRKLLSRSGSVVYDGFLKSRSVFNYYKRALKFFN